MKSPGQPANSLSEAGISKALVERIVAGDKTAESEMITRYQRGVEVVLFQKSQDRFIIDDVLQDTWLVVITKVRNGDLRDSSKLSSFIVQTAKNQLVMKFRKQAKVEESLDNQLAEPKATALSPQQESENAELGETINTVFKELNQERDRDILQRFFLTGETKPELCEALGLSPDHFDRVLYRARQRFQKLWQAQKSKTN